MIVNNPILKVDMPDPDVIRRGDTYYMVSTTMFYIPGGAILKSKDLVHWEMVSYIFDKLADNDIYNLKNGKNAYGKGQWATSLTFYHNKYYACFVCHDLKKTFIYYTDDIEKSYWDRYVIDEVFHDMSFLFWKDAVYLVYGNGTISIIQLENDLSGVKKDGLRQVLLETPKEGMYLCCEGCRAYVRNEYIYLSFIDVPSPAVGNGRRRQICYRAKELLGPYERRIIMDDDMGLSGLGVAQGPFIENEQGDWYAMLFQDRGSVGRIPFLMPVKWQNDWPVLGIDGKIPFDFEISNKEYKATPLVINDSLNHKENKLSLQWQWNHNPIPECWSFIERPGYLRLRTGQLASNLMDARNTLTQRTIEPHCAFFVEIDITGMKDGDYAGLCALQSKYGQIGIQKSGKEAWIVVTQKTDNKNLIETKEVCNGNHMFLKIVFDYENFVDTADFYYSLDGKNWIKMGERLCMKYTLDVFVGYRIGLFNYATKTLGGYADFRNLVCSND